MQRVSDKRYQILGWITNKPYQRIGNRCSVVKMELLCASIIFLVGVILGKGTTGDWVPPFSFPDSWRRSQNDVVVREGGTFCRPIYVVAPIKCVHDGKFLPYMLVRDLNHGISFLCMGVYVILGILSMRRM